MKKLVSLFLAVILLFSLVACSKGGDVNSTEPSATVSTAPNGNITTDPTQSETTPTPSETTPDSTTATVPDSTTATTPDNNGSGSTNNGGSTVVPSTAFVPTTRFVVTSDIHTRTTANNYKSHDRLTQLYQTAYAYADAQKDYNKLDAIFFVGDITNNGTLAEYKQFFNYVKANTRSGTVAQAILGNHEFYDTGKYTAESFAAAPQRFLEQSGYAAVDTNQVIGGYHFITMGMDKYDKNNNVYFSTTKLNWLKKQLDAAVAEDPNKPIFLFQHEPAAKTVVGSYGVNGDNGLKELLANYPQVIDFSGHSHRPLSDTRSIWQGSFTAVNTGSLAYLSLTIPDHENASYQQGSANAVDKEGSWGADQDMRDGVMYLIVETDKDNRVRIQIYNIETQSLWGETYLIDSFNPKDFKYTDDRKNTADTPVFPANAALTLRGVSDRTVTIAIPQATSKDVVQSYRVELYQGTTLKETAYRLSGINYGSAAPETIRATFSGLTASTGYTIKVHAVNSWAKKSNPLVLNFTTTTAGASMDADVLSVSFRQDGTAVNALTGEVLTTFGAPKVSYDNNLGKYVAAFDGKKDAYTYNGIAGWYNTLKKGFSVEAYIYLEKKPASGFMDFAANLNGGGFGLAYKNDGKLYFYCHAGGAYATPSAAAATGQWVHVVGIFDGSYAYLYVNGQLVDKKAASGEMKAPTLESQFFSIGSDTGKHDEALESMFQGKVADVKIYSAPISAQQIAELYNTYK